MDICGHRKQHQRRRRPLTPVWGIHNLYQEIVVSQIHKQNTNREDLQNTVLHLLVLGLTEGRDASHGTDQPRL
jgi:hypothetical protein